MEESIQILVNFLVEHIWQLAFIGTLIKAKECMTALLLILIEMLFGTQLWLYIVTAIVVIGVRSWMSRKNSKTTATIQIRDADDPDYK